ncbi:MAG TPA: glycine oxidase ThiO [Acidimicrobiales bacterium]|nr:glycine oxidase ThiO [Acidimicrobiales bacterium]
MRRPDVVVVGGGAIGLAVAWRATAAGLTVEVVDPAPGRGASWAAAGMLAPVTEVHYGEESLLGLNLASARRYPSFVAELEEAAGRPAGYRRCGTLAVAADNDDNRALGEVIDFQRRLGLEVERLTARQCRQLEPALAPSVRGGARVEGDHQVDPRTLLSALLGACGNTGVAFTTERVASVEVAGGRATGVRLASGTLVTSGSVVLAAGAWSPAIVPQGWSVPVRPVKGQILRLRHRGGRAILSGNLRGLVGGSQVYLVPRSDGRLVVGATAEEMGFDPAVTAGAVLELLTDACALVPDVAELELVETSAAFRPGTPDNAPLIGPSSLDGLSLATGHFRNGILLTPVTADAIAEHLVSGQLPDVAAPFTPLRFARSVA